MNFSKEMLVKEGRFVSKIPWRNTVNPYNIWLSEIMLQQTRVAQGTPYYLKFIKNFPSVNELANASEEKILKLWQGLGYYSRARNLHATAKLVSEKYNGNFPNTYNELLQLKGVGDYTASAIASISFDIPEPVVDGNVYRVLSRYFGVTLPINSSEGIKYFKELARKVMDTDHIRDYNQGIMEFGAIQCTPKNPSCNDCPLNSSCVALKEKKVGELPVKLKKLKIKNRYFNYLVIIDEHNRTVLQQRIGKGIWQHLYEFPLIELDQDIPLDKSEIDKRLKKLLIFGEEYEVYPLNENKIIHKLSHQHLYTTFWVLNVAGNIPDGIKVSEIGKYPVPVLIADFIKTFKF